MDKTERRVVITGIGLISPLGLGAAPHWEAMRAGRGAIDHVRAFPVAGLPSSAVAEIEGFEAKSLVLPQHKKTLQKSLKYMARDIQLAVVGAELAMSDAGFASGGYDPTRTGVDLGAGLISSELDELAEAIHASFRPDGTFDFRTFGHAAMKDIQPIWLLKYLPNMLACHISILWDCQGPSNTITEAEAAANVAMGEAFRIIGRNQADVMITGGADSKIHPLSLVRMQLQEQLTTWSGPVNGSCRPFDERRCGTVPGEGAGILIFEERERALGRGAKIYGEVRGFGSGCDAMPGGGLDPNGRGVEVAIRAALRDAGVEPGEIGHVNAHGAGTVMMDLAEARAIDRVFGPEGVPVTGLKGYIGNVVSGCGAVELLSSLLALRDGVIPMTLHCDEVDPQMKLDVVRGEARRTINPLFVNVNVTRHGQAAALVVEAVTA
jgi:3-oxoacyl-[acyl-carrier-protein] synthase II